jgi:hypothetical protein
MSPRPFPPPWQVEQTPGGFKVLDANGQALVYVYARETSNEANIAEVLTLDKEHLTADGALPPVPPRPLTEKELLDKELDEAFPNAQSKQIVEHKGRKYRRRFWPLDKSRSGKTVHEWGCDWIEIDKG